MKLRDVIRATLSRPVAFHAVLAKVCGSATAGLMLSQAIYWSERTEHSKDGWFYKSQAEWEEEICLTRWEQETARRILKAKGLMVDARRGNPARLWYRVDQEAVARAVGVYIEGHPSEPRQSEQAEKKPPVQIVGKPQSRLREGHSLESGKPADKSAGKQQTLKEAETTTETTAGVQDLGDGLRPPPATGKTKPEEPDPRHQAVVDAIAKCWPPGIPFEFDAADGGALKRMLLRRPKFTAAELAECVFFRAMSANVNPTESVKAWIGALTDYASGPQDKYTHPPDARDLREYWKPQARRILYGSVAEQIEIALDKLGAEAAERSLVPLDVDAPAGRELWAEALRTIEQQVDKHSFGVWFKPTRGIGAREHDIFVRVPTAEFSSVLSCDKYGGLLAAALPAGTEIHFVTEGARA